MNLSVLGHPLYRYSRMMCVQLICPALLYSRNALYYMLLHRIICMHHCLSVQNLLVLLCERVEGARKLLCEAAAMLTVQDQGGHALGGRGCEGGASHMHTSCTASHKELQFPNGMGR